MRRRKKKRKADTALPAFFRERPHRFDCGEIVTLKPSLNGGAAQSFTGAPNKPTNHGAEQKKYITYEN
jgi:hypothetical protein